MTETTSKSRSKETNLTLLDLHEDIFRIIFRYLDDAEVYFTVRVLCQKLKNYVDAYIQLGGIFMLAGEPNKMEHVSIKNPTFCTKLLHVFKQNGKVSSIGCSTTMSAIPVPICKKKSQRNKHNRTSTHYSLEYDIGSFGVKFNGKIVVGIYYTEYSGWESSWERNKTNLGSDCYLAEYDKTKNTWTQIRPNPTCYNKTDVIGQIADATGDNQVVLTSCPIGDSILMLTWKSLKYFVNDENDQEIHIRRLDLNVTDEPKWSILASTMLREKYCRNPVQTISSYCNAFNNNLTAPRNSNEIMRHCTLCTITPMHDQCTITQVANNKVILLGGANYFKQPNHRLWEGTLTKDQKTITWTSMKLGPIKARIRPICFKLKENLYIAGGQPIEATNNGSSDSKTNRTSLLCCDVYNLQEKKLTKSVHFLPYPVDDVDKIATDADETFALITRLSRRTQHGKNGNYLTFTEKYGFEELSNPAFDETSFYAL